MATNPNTVIVRQGVEKAFLAFSARVEGRGFKKTRNALWMRSLENGNDVIHLHRSGISYGAPRNASVSFRVHFARWPVGATDGPLNGPSSDAGSERKGSYHLRFNAKSGSTFDRCIDDLVRFVEEVGEPWYASLGL